MKGSCSRLTCVKLRIGYITFPVNARRRFNVVRRRINIETTSSVYKDSLNSFYNNTFVVKPISRFSFMKNSRLNNNRLCRPVGTIFILEWGGGVVGGGGRLLDEKNFLKMPATTGHWRSKF